MRGTEKTMDDEMKKRLYDYFEGYELVEVLNISIERVVEAFEEDILKQLNEIEYYTNYGR